MAKIAPTSSRVCATDPCETREVALLGTGGNVQAQSTVAYAHISDLLDAQVWATRSLGFRHPDVEAPFSGPAAKT